MDRRRTERRSNTVPVAADRRAPVDRRRGDRRQSARAPLDLWVEEEQGNELYFRRTGNVSAGGLFLEHTIPHALGTRVRLRFSLPGETELIEASADVVSTPNASDGLGMGLQFVHVSEQARARLEQFLAHAPRA
jgi:uncharacterized protein (TIGR02266 family)